MMPYVNISCDEMKRNSPVLNTHYNNVRYVEFITRGNEIRCCYVKWHDIWMEFVKDHSNSSYPAFAYGRDHVDNKSARW